MLADLDVTPGENVDTGARVYDPRLNVKPLAGRRAHRLIRARGSRSQLYSPGWPRGVEVRHATLSLGANMRLYFAASTQGSPKPLTPSRSSDWSLSASPWASASATREPRATGLARPVLRHPSADGRPYCEGDPSNGTQPSAAAPATERVRLHSRKQVQRHQHWRPAYRATC